MKVDSGKIRASVAAYMRYVRQSYLVAFEADSADVLALSEADLLTEIEVKISLADLHRDKGKSKHWFYKNGQPNPRFPRYHFYFAVPKDIANKVCEICSQKYPYAGVLGTNGGPAHSVEVYRKAKQLSCEPISPVKVKELTKQQSGTVCRLAMRLNGIDY